MLVLSGLLAGRRGEYTFLESGTSSNWFRLLEPGPGEEDMGRKGGLEHWCTWPPGVTGQSLSEVRKLFRLAYGGGDRRLVICRQIDQINMSIDDKETPDSHF